MGVVRCSVLVAAVVITAASLAGCSGCSGNGPLLVRKILVDVEPAATGVDREQIRGVVEETLKKARGISIVDPGRTDASVVRVRVEGYGPQAGEGAGGADAPGGGGGPQKTTLALTLEVTSVAGDPGSGFRGHALASGLGAVDARTLVAQALRDALAQVLMSRNAGEQKSEQLIAWLGDDEASDDQKRRAIRILGSRREKAAVSAIAKVLLNGDKELQPLALSALTNIGDPGAVDAVIAYSDRQPSLVRKQCIEAVRSMGSADARAKAWLFTLSTGSPDIDVQEQAAAALANLEAQTVTLDGPGAARDRGQHVAQTVDGKPKTQATP